jgi:hypothetical protein
MPKPLSRANRPKPPGAISVATACRLAGASPSLGRFWGVYGVGGRRLKTFKVGRVEHVRLVDFLAFMRTAEEDRRAAALERIARVESAIKNGGAS